MPEHGHVVLEINGLEKRFGLTHALADVSLEIRSGEVHAIVGENGAGKSTLVSFIAGVLPTSSLDAGGFVADGERRSFANSRDAEADGIFLVPQEITVVPETTVAENLMLGHEPLNRWGFIDPAVLWSETRKWIDAFELDIDPAQQMRWLSVGEQQLISIARAMSRGARILILDEPSTSLTDVETELLFHHIEACRARGVSILYISHRLSEIGRLADRVTVMRDGHVVEEIAGGDAEEVPRRIIRAMVGRDLDDLYPRRSTEPGERVLEVAGLTVQNHRKTLPPVLEDVAFEIRRGEVLGVYGPAGSGASDLAPALFGAEAHRVEGEVRLNSVGVRFTSPRAAISAGLAYLTADRKHTGLVPRASVADNLSLAVLKRLSRGLFMDRAAELGMVDEYVTRLRVKVQDVGQRIVELSGGNQQKVLVGKWMATHPDLLLFEEPTRGVDVGARVEIYGLINECTAMGMAILLISTDLPEVLGMSDRVLAVNKGRIAGEWSAADVTQAQVIAAATADRVDSATRAMEVAR